MILRDLCWLFYLDSGVMRPLFIHDLRGHLPSTPLPTNPHNVLLVFVSHRHGRLRQPRRLSCHVPNNLI
jgi:hypothetical protein